MSSFRALPALALTAICFTLATDPADAAPPPSPTTREMVKALARQGVSPDEIWAVDPAGIPMVCAEPARADGFAARSLGSPASAVLPDGTRSWEAVPSVIRSDGADSFRLEVDVNGPVSRVRLADVFLCLKPPLPPPFDLRDDGTGGDRVAGDFIYTSGEIRYNTACPFAPPAFFLYDKTSPAGIWTQTIGNISVEELNGDQNQFLIHPMVGLMLPELPAAEIRQLTSDVAVSPHLVNVRTNQRAAQSTVRLPISALPELTAAIYKALPDAFDFLMFFSIDHVERVPQLTFVNFIAGLHYPVKTDYSGTGLSQFDNSAYFGSHGRLLSMSFLDTQERGLISRVAMHEITHQWASHTSLSLGLAEGTGHYNSRSSAASLVGGLRFVDLGNGSFVLDCTEGGPGAHRAPPIDRYMAGLIPGSEVPPLHVYSSSLPTPNLFCGQTFSALDRTVTIEEIQAEHGVRTPGPEASRRDFAVAFVAESFNRLLTKTEMTYYEILAEHFAHEAPAAEPDPYLGFNWVSGTRYWGPGVTWTSALPLGPAFVEAAFDLKPGSCPSQVNLGSRGVVPAAILGTAQLDVRTIDPASLRVLGLAPLRTAREDVAAPFFPLLGRDEAGDCTAQGPDGRLDLTLKLSTTDLQRAVQQHLGRPPKNGELVVLPLTGRLLPEHGGREIRGEDVLVVLAKGK